MAKKIFFLLVTVLAVTILGVGCGNNEEGEDEGQFFTVTFEKNTDDPGVVIDPPTVKVSAGKAIGDEKNMPKTPRAVDEGWEAGYMIKTWNTSPTGTGGKPFNRNTQVKEDMTVYAQWGYDQSQYIDADGSLVVIAPAIAQSDEGTHATFKGDVNPNLSITWYNGAIRWKFPDEGNAKDYDFVEISYIATLINNPNANTIGNNDPKLYGAGAYIPTHIGTTPATLAPNNSAYPSLPAPTGTLKYTVRDATGTTPGMAIRINSSDVEANKRTMKFTKAVFTQGKRYPITFDLDYEGAPTVAPGFGVQGLSIGELLLNEKYPLQNKPGSTFEGWINAATNAVVTSATPVSGPLNLKAKWGEAVHVDRIVVDFSDTTKTRLTAMGGGGSKVTAKTFEETDGTNSSGYEFVYGSSSNSGYSGSWAKFTVTLDGANLAAYKQVTFEGIGISGDTGNKPFALLAGSPTLTMQNDPHTDGSTIRINSNNPFPDSNYIGSSAWKTVTFEINKPKAAALKGSIEFCIYDHSGYSNGSDPTTWQIKNVTFIPAED